MEMQTINKIAGEIIIIISIPPYITLENVIVITILNITLVIIININLTLVVSKYNRKQHKSALNVVRTINSVITLSLIHI